MNTMNSQSRSLEFSILTPAGRGAVATVRLEGPNAAQVAAAHLSPKTAQALLERPANSLIVGHFNGASGEEMVVRRLPCGDVELHCHGGLAAVARVEQALHAAGASRISWQEWAARQEPDPIAAAARVALAEAATARVAAILVDQYRGALRRAFNEIEAAAARGEQDRASKLADDLLSRARLGAHLTRPWHVALAGRPNVGKSTLINALAGYHRAIVHSQPGTTRDIVTLNTAIDGWPVEICDTAGLRDSDDLLETRGMQKARELMATADLVVLLFDRSGPWTEEDAQLAAAYPQALVVHSKSDLLAAGERPVPGIAICAKEDGGAKGSIDELCKAIAVRLVPNPPGPGEAVPFLPVHTDWLQFEKRASCP
jgi:tRNA modification GTPase